MIILLASMLSVSAVRYGLSSLLVCSFKTKTINFSFYFSFFFLRVIFGQPMMMNYYILLLFLSSACVAAGFMYPRVVTSGTCGEHLTWSYNESSNKLTIKGTGSMNNYSSSLLPPWNSFNETMKSLVVESGVSSIGTYAFYNHVSLVNVTLPPTLTSIGEHVFYGCSNLTSIVIPNGIEEIPDFAFYECSNLYSVTLPDSITSIGAYSFWYCTRLSSITIPSGVTKIDQSAFEYCTSLTSIKIPSSVESIGRSLFGGCYKLTSIEVDPANPSFESIEGLLVEKKTKSLLSFPCGKHQNTTIPASVTSIRPHAFYGCSDLPSVTLHENITSIGGYAFYNCQKLTSIIIPSSVTKLENGVFSCCFGLKALSYLGNYDPGASSLYVFIACTQQINICVPNSYNSSSFCGANVTCKSSSCDTIFLRQNKCYEFGVKEDECIIKKTVDAEDWENKTNGCVQYECNNETGRVYWNKCNNSTCVDGQCMDETSITDKSWAVEVDINVSESAPITPEEVAAEVSQVSGINVSDITVGIEYDDKGVAVRIIIYVSEESDAKIIETSLNNMDKGDTCEGVLCDTEEAHTREVSHVLFLAVASRRSDGWYTMVVSIIVSVISILISAF